ncbi:hypothetical protein [Roseateles albus]|uniref:GIY-YIG nuclease family protein n=1 Tax=Roseateles albus TaxID=2987525 RepID=A0ABT5KHE5_9BURK|nr:hypothetical protein [Roseateles albus]MDC8773343.1 hypothetical protein [Roseateles albus]
MTNLYILLFPQKGIIKVGKANDIANRIAALRLSWGRVDYDASYYVLASEDVVFKIESWLKFSLSKYAAPFREGDGWTEVFTVNALEIALRYIDLYCSSAAEVLEIRRGIPLPLIKSPTPRRCNKYAKLARKANSVTQSVLQISETFSWLNRLLIILLRRQASIAYSYNIDERFVYFRLSMPDKSWCQIKSLISALHRYRSIRVETIDGCMQRNLYLISNSCDNVIKLEIELTSSNDENPGEKLLSYMLHESLVLLKKLPPRSAAATSPIPILD